ncbi:Scr1 family TA system antitoxin-like transcriptional regulator [Glycomyces paridis]|uniref:Helix-turn-helix transcriptional regulator n=1 Tax=Glycomyces paridis TaxID=2126555 RepID=A0A4S8PF64_9ACTN|nr:Scr1 family TA system antitoxin-like transcriptional regulator [Glycomyces paridis]THV29040.1 helix-turn-helix transcriptional regulator [Glycomyces paridis]
MAASMSLHRRLIESYLTAEVNMLAQSKGWTLTQFAKVVTKSTNTIRAWLEGRRIPDKGNLMLICDKAGAEPERKAFIAHVSEKLFLSSELISGAEVRNLYIVESAERNYRVLVKWDPLLMSGLLQTEAVHMNLLAGPMEDPASKVKWWKRKEARQSTYFGRCKGRNHPVAEFYVPARAIADLDQLTLEEKAEQLERLRWVDSLPGCEVLVVEPLHFAPYAFEMFTNGGRASSAPDFVYVENLDQSRHIVESDKIALYDEVRRSLRSKAQGIGRFLDGGVHQLAEEHPEH